MSASSSCQPHQHVSLIIMSASSSCQRHQHASLIIIIADTVSAVIANNNKHRRPNKAGTALGSRQHESVKCCGA
eukprot:3580600-Rhodomonas_salina.5